jgi:hypothetical protein
MRSLVLVTVVCLSFSQANADDATKARAALALAAAMQPTSVVAGESRTPNQAAKAALAEAANLECDCGACGVARPMPTASTSAIPEKVDYPTLLKKVEQLKPGESVRVFAGVASISDSSFSGSVYLVEAIAGESPGVWRCWVNNGTATMQRLHLGVNSAPLPVTQSSPLVVVTNPQPVFTPQTLTVPTPICTDCKSTPGVTVRPR